MMKADPLVDSGGSEKQEIMVETPPEGGKPAEPPRPEKKPPLNDQ
jgi:hypothetical protein